MSNDTPQIDPASKAEAFDAARAKAAIEKDKQERLARFDAKVKQAMAEERCDYRAVMIIPAGELPRVQLLPVALD